MSDYATTGDGLVAALQVLAMIAQSDHPASQVCQRFWPLPQVLKSLRHGGGDILGLPVVTAAITAAEQRLGRTGRLLIRKSGTEPLIRVMAEGEDAALVEDVVDGLIAVIGQAAGAP
jgi:phosphoglucosamine mutase